MTDQLVSFETAKLAKEKGFNIQTIHWYDQTETLNPIKGIRGSMCYTNEGYAPTQSLLQRWLREVHDIHICIEVYEDNTYEAGIISDLIQEEWEDDVSFSTYEEALEWALQECLKLIP